MIGHPLQFWAERYGISQAALIDLCMILGADAPDTNPSALRLTSEAGVQQQVRLEAARQGRWLLRNNSGACEDKDGRQIRYGLANESKQMNEKIKSSDLVGITPVTCRCGWRYGVFTGLECKPPGWHLTPGDKRGQAQLTFIQKVISLGGIARFVTKPEDIQQ